MIAGVGIDIVDVGKFSRAVHRRGERFLKRLFTAEELSYCLGKKKRHEHLAARFACKVSFFKAVGAFFPYKDVEVVRAQDGRPGIRLRSKGADLRCKVAISISHDGDLAIAHAIAEYQ